MPKTIGLSLVETLHSKEMLEQLDHKALEIPKTRHLVLVNKHLLGLHMEGNQCKDQLRYKAIEKPIKNYKKELKRN